MVDCVINDVPRLATRTSEANTPIGINLVRLAFQLALSCLVGTHLPRSLVANLMLAQDERLALSNRRISLRGRPLPANQFHFNCKRPSAMGWIMIHRQMVDRKAIRVFNDRPRGHFGCALPSNCSRAKTSKPRRREATRHHEASEAQSKKYCLGRLFERLFLS